MKTESQKETNLENRKTGEEEKRPYGCKCQTLRERALGDGCDECNKAQAIEYLQDEIAEMRAEMEEIIVLLDGAYNLVEIHGGGSPYNDKWRKNWMEKARSFGATPSL